MIALNLLLLPLLGIFGAGISLVAGTLFHFTLTARLWYKRFRVKNTRLSVFQFVVLLSTSLPLFFGIPLIAKLGLIGLVVGLAGALFTSEIKAAKQILLGR